MASGPLKEEVDIGWIMALRRFKMKKSILVLILGFVLATSYAFAETMMIEAQGIGDGYYYSYGPSRQWYGNEWWVRVTFGNYVTNLYETGYIQYSLLEAPEPSLIDSITLNIKISGVSGSGGIIKYLPDATGANGDASQRLTGTVEVASLGSGTSAGWISFDVTSLLKDDIEDGMAWAPFSFHANYCYSGNCYSGFNIYAAESGDASYLEFMYTPVPAPATALLMMGGLAALGLKRKKR